MIIEPQNITKKFLKILFLNRSQLLSSKWVGLEEKYIEGMTSFSAIGLGVRGAGHLHRWSQEVSLGLTAL